ncbi:peptidylprolyl isomerase [Ectothiorhodospiraceae bacterium 2226]|nr:peptidylprolyl isomerase [Ectothiorhodospiraceae bacterium 2226]
MEQANSGPAVGPGSKVAIRYTLALPDGTVADESGDTPLHFTLGDGTMIQGLEYALYGMHAGEQRCVRIDPRDAFGYRDPHNVHVMSRGTFDAKMPLEPGTVIGFTTPAGDEVPGTIDAVEGDEVRVDFNHPLAGIEVTFDVEVLEVQAPANEE